MITVFDDAYPDNLKVLRMHPVLLYVRGSAEILNAGKAAAVIGTREPTEYAVKMDEAISHKLGKDGYVIVSGLAKAATVMHKLLPSGTAIRRSLFSGRDWVPNRIRRRIVHSQRRFCRPAARLFLNIPLQNR